MLKKTHCGSKTRIKYSAEIQILVKLQKTVWLIIFDGKDEQKLQWFWITNVTAVCLGQRAQSQNKQENRCKRKWGCLITFYCTT